MHKQLMQVSKRKEKSTEHVADIQSAKAQSCTSFTNNGKLISTFSEMCMDLKMFSRHTFHYSCSEHSISSVNKTGKNSCVQHTAMIKPLSPPGYCQCLEGTGAGGEGLRGVAADRDPPPGET